jgi:hypothetical protein
LITIWDCKLPEDVMQVLDYIKWYQMSMLRLTSADCPEEERQRLMVLVKGLKDKLCQWVCIPENEIEEWNYEAFMKGQEEGRETMPYTSFGTFAKHKRELNNLTQEDCAKGLDYGHRSTYHRKEVGKLEWSFEDVEKLAKYYGLKTSQLLDEFEEFNA